MEALSQRVQELRNSITSFIVKLEQEHSVISWFVDHIYVNCSCHVRFYLVNFLNCFKSLAIGIWYNGWQLNSMIVYLM